MRPKKLYIETYGCQMNFSDSDIIASIMIDDGIEITKEISGADYIFVNTCSIRDHAEQRVRKRLREFKSLKREKPSLRIGLLGCMAERLKEQLLEEEKLVDMIIGPDAYRDLPKLLKEVDSNQKAINVILDHEETYADINPVRFSSNGVGAFISIMRGCENFCSYCVVPYVRGKERSREPSTIIIEARELFEKGYREVTLLGQNVNSFNWKRDKDFNFANLLKEVAQIDPLLRVRFATSHPKDISEELLHTIARHNNICRSIHLPVQSGSSRILDLMNRKYTIEWYMNRIEAIWRIIPGCAISTDIICGFPGETEEDFRETLSLMEWAGFDYAFMFKYSERPNTIAWKKFKDDISDEEKGRRLKEVIDLQRKLSHKSNLNDIGNTYRVLIEGTSKKSDKELFGRNTQNKVIVFPKKESKKGDYINVLVKECTSATLIGEIVE